MIRANDPKLTSWVEVPQGSDFPIQNLPFGIFKTAALAPRVCTAIGNHVADLFALAEHGFFDDLSIDRSVFSQSNLNEFIALGKEKTRAVRDRLSLILDEDFEEWDASGLAEFFLHKQDEVELLLPIQIGDYTDFYSSMEHAKNVGSMFRDPENALLPNWKHLPVGYHGRSSSIVVSGTPVIRPKGQTLPKDHAVPIYGPSKLLDFELEMAFVIGKENALGKAVSTADAEEFIFGLVLFNDWSARDIQKWEYVPLGPFLGKNFASTISPWVVTLDALEPFRVDGPIQDPQVLPYLQYEGQKNYDLQLEVFLQPESGEATRISVSNSKYLYWNMCQQLAHHTVNGCNLHIGDLLASGTISGTEPTSYGSMLELSWRGSKPIALVNGQQRTFLEDKDTIILKGFGERNGIRIGFGEANGQISPSIE